MTDKTPAMPEPTQEQLDAFIARAGFRYGWGNLESWARTMAEQAVSELAALQSAQPAEVSDAEIRDALEAEFLGEPGKRNLEDDLRVARASLARLRPQAVPMTDGVKERALDLLATMFDAYENGVPCHEGSDNYIGMAFRLDDETFHACADTLNAHRPKTHHGITPRADGGEE